MTRMADDTSEPEFLYRYRSLRDYSREDVERVLAHREVRFSSPARFNDPFDCKVPRSLTASDGTVETWLRERCRREIQYRNVKKAGAFAETPPDLENQVEQKLHELWPTRNKIFDDDAALLQERIDNSGVLSFSELGNDILMWSHYADGHRGICLKFRRDALKFPKGDVRPPPFKNVFYEPESVSYSEAYPAISLVNLPPWEWYRAWLMTKSCHWRYEREWRIILQLEPLDGEDAYGWDVRPTYQPAYGWATLPGEAIAGVILGCEIKREDEQRVREWRRMGGVQVPLLRAQKKPDRFELEIRDTE